MCRRYERVFYEGCIRSKWSPTAGLTLEGAHYATKVFWVLPFSFKIPQKLKMRYYCPLFSASQRPTLAISLKFCLFLLDLIRFTSCIQFREINRRLTWNVISHKLWDTSFLSSPWINLNGYVKKRQALKRWHYFTISQIDLSITTSFTWHVEPEPLSGVRLTAFWKRSETSCLKSHVVVAKWITFVPRTEHVSDDHIQATRSNHHRAK